jgi:hypothetical protein
VILRREDGTESPFGPTCAVKVLGKPVGPIPNLTTAAILSVEDKAGAATGTKKSVAGDLDGKVDRPIGQREDRDVERAATYLELRMGHLARCPGVFYRPLVEAYDLLRRGVVLNQVHVSHILRIEKFNEANKPQFSLRNLLAVYAFESGITAALVHVPGERRGFLLGMRRALRQNLSLSAAQAAAVSSWLKRIPNQPDLDPSGFSWAWRAARTRPCDCRTLKSGKG